MLQTRPTPQAETTPRGRNAPETVVRRRRVSLPVLAITIVVGAVLTLGGWGLHRWQKQRVAEYLLSRSERLKEAGELQEAAENLAGYLELQPADVQRQIELARAYVQLAEEEPELSGRAIVLLYQAVGACEDPQERVDLRRRLIRLLVDTYRYGEALELLAEQPRAPGQKDPGRHWWQDPEDLRLAALAGTGRVLSGGGSSPIKISGPGGTQEAFYPDELLSKAREYHPDDPVLATLLADLYRQKPELLRPELQGLTQLERFARANQVMDQMVAQAGGDPQAHLARSRYRRLYQLPGAAEDIEAALRSETSDPEVLLAGGEFLLEQAVALASRQEELSRQQSVLARLEAEDPLSASAPPDAGTSPESGEEGPSQEVRSLLERAEALFQRVLEQHPSSEDALVGLGRVWQALGKDGEAVALWTKALGDMPSHAVRLRLSLAEAMLEQGELDRAEETLQQAERAVGQLVAQRRATTGQRHNILRSVQLTRARLLMEQKKYGQALPLLRAAATIDPDVQPGPAGLQVRYYAMELLAQCSMHLGQWAGAAQVYEEVASQAQTTLRHLLRRIAARLWLQAGHPQRAVQLLQLARADVDTPEAWYELAVARLALQKRLPPGQRDWQSVDEALNGCKNADGSPRIQAPWRLDLLKIQVTLARSDLADPQQMGQILAAMRQLERQYVDVPRFLAALAVLFQSLGATADADRVAGRFAEQAEPPADVVLKAQLLAMRGQPEEGGRLLEQASRDLPEAQRPGVQLLAAQLELLAGRPQAAARVAESETLPLAARIRLVVGLAERALQQEDLAATERWESRLRELEGPDGFYWRLVRAQRLLIALRKNNPGPNEVDSVLREAEALQRQASALQPTSPLPATLAALIALHRQDLDAAIAAFQQAVTLGESRWQMLQLYANTLLAAGRVREAQRVIARLQDRVPQEHSLSALAMELAKRQGLYQQALQTAERRTQAAPQDAEAWFLLAQAQIMSERWEAAEESVRRAVRLKPESARYWLTLIQLLAQQQKREEARKALEEMLAAVQPSSQARRWVLAGQGYRVLGEEENAQYAFAKAAEFGKDEPDVLVALGQHHLQAGDHERAIAVLEPACRLRPGDQEAKRLLALALVARGDEESINRALGLVKDQPAGTADRRLQALILVQRGGPDARQQLREAIQLLRDGPADQRMSDWRDQVLLGNLLARQAFASSSGQELTSQLDEALRALQDAARRSDAAPGIIAQIVHLMALRSERLEAAEWVTPLKNAYIRTQRDKTSGLLAAAMHLRALRLEGSARQTFREAVQGTSPSTTPTGQVLAVLQSGVAVGALKDLKPWVEELARRQPHSPEGVYYQILLASELEGSERALQLARSLVRQCEEAGLAAEAQKEVVRQAARALRQAGLYAEALTLYQRLHDDSAGTLMGRVECLAQVGDSGGALQLCMRAYQASGALLPVLAAIRAAFRNEALRTHKEFETLMAAARMRHSDSVVFLSDLATLRIMQQREQEAEELLRACLETSPNDPVVLNNLANVLAQRPERAGEALELVDRAIILSGPVGAFLDTKGMILFHQGRLQDAATWIRAAVGANPDDPRHLLHMAAVLDRLGETEQAAQFLDQAWKADLAAQVLTSADTALLNSLIDKYPPGGRASPPAASTRPAG